MSGWSATCTRMGKLSACADGTAEQAHTRSRGTYGRRLGRRARRWPPRPRGPGDVPVGAVVVGADGDVIGGATTCARPRDDPTGHAEILALRAAAASVGRLAARRLHPRRDAGAVRDVRRGDPARPGPAHRASGRGTRRPARAARCGTWCATRWQPPGRGGRGGAGEESAALLVDFFEGRRAPAPGGVEDEAGVG